MNLVQYAVAFAASTVGFFSLAHVAARNVGPIDAIRDSWTVVKRNIWMFLLAAVLFQLIGSLGFAALCIGGLVTVPLWVAATAQAYADHFGLEYAQLE